jgi:demethylmenaquinone methyltransferase/2-methoxy-6-polyprenyl-1,4-benzoquinol methylase
MDDDSLLADQRAFYRARAPEYDEWWERRGRYDHGVDDRREWDRQVAQVDEALAAFDARGRVLELAGGTGWWTERLARTADHLTVLDASAETLAINRDRVARADIDYVVADLFEWRPDCHYDVVFFSFWISHVPRTRFGPFWSLVRSCLQPSGRVFLIDNRTDPEPGTRPKDPYIVEYMRDVQVRRLNDGSEHLVVKVMYEPDELQALVEAAGWYADIGATRWFIFGSARPRPH